MKSRDLEVKRDKYLPALSKHFGLHPWDVDRLTYHDFEVYCSVVDEMNRQATK